MCALLYYLCLKYALFHFFFPFHRTHHHHLFYIVSITGRAEGSFCFPEPSMAVGTLPIQLWGGGLPKLFEVCHHHPQIETVTYPMLPDFWRTFKINHSCELIFIIANPTDKFYGCLPEKY